MTEVSPIRDTLRIALMGDYNPDVVARQAIPLAINDTAAVLELVADYDWLTTSDISGSEGLIGYDVIWVIPGSPYHHLKGALIAIRHARENSIPFLGTCDGFQHAILEYTRNVLGWNDAAHAETDTTSRMVIAPLTCSLVGKTDDIELRTNTLIAKTCGWSVITERYHCNYGVSEDLAAELESGGLRVTDWDEVGGIHATEPVMHSFYVGALFQHERGALAGKPVPSVQAMLRAAHG